MRGVMIGQYPHGGEIITGEDDALWAAIEESGAPVSIHVGFALAARATRPGGRRAGPTGALRFFDAPIRAAQFIESGVFDRFPNLRLVLVEVDSSWVPYIAEQMDDRFQRTRAGDPARHQAAAERVLHRQHLLHLHHRPLRHQEPP